MYIGIDVFVEYRDNMRIFRKKIIFHCYYSSWDQIMHLNFLLYICRRKTNVFTV
jgi:hypothetical protein